MSEHKCDNQPITVVTPIVLSEKDLRNNQYGETYKIEEDDLIKYVVKFYYMSHKYEKPTGIRISNHLPPELELIAESTYCGDYLLEGDIRKGIDLPEELLLEVSEIAFLCKAKKINRECFENQVVVDYEYETEQGRYKKITIESATVEFQYIWPRLELNLSLDKDQVKALDTMHYKLEVVNTGNTVLYEACLKECLPSEIEYIQGSLYINGELALIPEFHGLLDLGKILPEERIEIAWEALVVEAELEEKTSHYVEVSYFYEKEMRKKAVSRSNTLMLTKKIEEDRKDKGHKEAETCKQCGSYALSEGINIRQQVEVERKKHEETIHYTVWIENESRRCLVDAYMLYHLYYRLKVVPNTLRLNDYVIKGNIDSLRLPLIEEAGKKQSKVKISFDAIIKKEFQNADKLCCQSYVRIKGKEESGRCFLTKANCIKIAIGRTEKPTEICKQIQLPKGYDPIEEVEQCEVKVEAITPVKDKSYEIAYKLRIYYRSQNKKNEMYEEREVIEINRCCGRPITEVTAYIKGKPLVCSPRCVQVAIIFIKE